MSTQNNPQVTCIVPMFNHEKFVQDALKSLVNQTYKKIRIVCCDDGSKDNTFEKAKELCDNLVPIPIANDEPKELFQGKISGIPIILSQFHENHGPSMARNFAIKCGWDGTDVFALLDSDDWYEPEKIEKSLYYFNKFPNLVGCVYSDYTTVNVQTNLECRVFCYPYIREILNRECIINCDSLVSKWAIEKGGMFPENQRVAEDYMFWSNILKQSLACHIPESLIKIRVGRHSSTDTVSQEEWVRCVTAVKQSMLN